MSDQRPGAHLDLETLSALHDGELSGREAETAGVHLAECAACAQHLADLQGLSARLHALPDPAPPAGGWAAVARAAAERSRSDAKPAPTSRGRHLALAASAFLGVVLVGLLVHDQLERGALEQPLRREAAAPGEAAEPSAGAAAPASMASAPRQAPEEGGRAKRVASKSAADGQFLDSDEQRRERRTAPAQRDDRADAPARASVAHGDETEAARETGAKDVALEARSAVTQENESLRKAEATGDLGAIEPAATSRDAAGRAASDARAEGEASSEPGEPPGEPSGEPREAPPCDATGAAVTATPEMLGLEIPDWLRRPRATPQQVLRLADLSAGVAEVRVEVGRGGEVRRVESVRGDAATFGELALALRSQTAAAPVRCRGRAVDAVLQARYLPAAGGWTAEIVAPTVAADPAAAANEDPTDR